MVAFHNKEKQKVGRQQDGWKNKTDGRENKLESFGDRVSLVHAHQQNNDNDPKAVIYYSRV